MDAHIADGIRYIFRVADKMHCPAVVNLSLGGHFDSHDGTDSLSLTIDDESGPGKIVCCAAGNEGNDNIHAHASVKQNKTKTIRFNVPAAGYGEDCYVGLNIWYSGHDQMAIAIRSPDGSVTEYQGVIPSEDPERIHLLDEGKVTVVTPGPDPINGDHNIFVFIENPIRPTFPVKSGVWRIQFRGDSIEKGTLDAWTFTNMDSEILFTGTSVMDSVKVGSPGAANRGITVASYTTKVQWVDILGTTQYKEWDLDDISDFSSEGPLRDGTRKPDIAAPGAMITSALSSDSELIPSNQVSSEFRVMAGTSMATPFVTGIVALLLERDPTLDPEGVKELFRKHSKIPRKKAGTFNKKWGYGLIHLDNI
jgi:subtilisin family serine protease